MLPNEETTRSDLAAKPGELEALLAVANRDQARPIVAFLREQRLNVTLVQDADSAFEEAVLHRPNLVVVHQELPPAGGLEFCQRIKANTRTHFLPTIVFASGNGAPLRATAFAAGADAIFTNGDDPDERRARLWALLRTQALFRRHERKRESQGAMLRERGQWLGSFMHDLQNAVGALQANFDFLGKAATPPPQTSELRRGVRPVDIEECTAETHVLLQQLAHGLRTVQEYERFESGRIGLKEGLFSPVELLNEVCVQVRDQTRAEQRMGGTPGLAAGLTIDAAGAEGPGELPLATGDRDLLRRALAALVMLLARRPRASAVHLHVRSSPEGVSFVLMGNGEPIPPHEEGQLFDPYAQSARKGALAERFELALARAIVDVHRGRLQAISEPGASGDARGVATLGFSLELRSRESWPKSH